MQEENKWRLATAIVIASVLLTSSLVYFIAIRDDPVRDRPRPWLKRSDLTLPVDSEYLESAVRAGIWLANAQTKDGSFRYEYNPNEDEYSYEPSHLREIGSAYGMLLLYGNYPEPVLLDAGKLAAGWVKGYISYIDDDRAHFYALGESNLGGAALAVMCFYEYSRVCDGKYDHDLGALGNFIVSCQEDNGRLRSWYMMTGSVIQPGDKLYTEHTDYYPGEAFLALAMLYDKFREDKYLQCWKKAFDYYYDLYGGDHSPYTPFSPWAGGAMAMMYRYVQDPRYVNMSLSMADDVLDSQGIFPPDFERQSYVGGFYYERWRSYERDPANASAIDSAYQPRSNTASKIEGVVDLAWMIRQNDLPIKEHRYVESSFLSADFLSQIQYDENESRAYKDPQRVYGGVPGGVVDPQIRVDFCQHAMVTWLKVYRYLERGEDIHQQRIIAGEGSRV